jgi:hypothetical protein
MPPNSEHLGDSEWPQVVTVLPPPEDPDRSSLELVASIAVLLHLPLQGSV